MGFCEFVLSFLEHLDSQPSCVIEAGCAQMEHFVHPVITRRCGAQLEHEPQAQLKPKQDCRQRHQHQHRQGTHADAAQQQQGRQSPRQSSSSPASNKAVKSVSVPMSAATGSQTKDSPQPAHDEGSPSAGTTSTVERAYIEVCRTPVAMETSIDDTSAGQR